MLGPRSPAAGWGQAHPEAKAPPGGQQAPLNPREHRPQPRVCSRRPQLAPVGECVSARPAPARKGSCLGSSSEAGPPGPRGRAAPALEGRGGRSSLCSDSRAARNRGHLMGHGARGRRVRFGIENSHLLPARLWPRRVPGPGINTLPSEPPSASTRSPGAGPGLPPPVSHGVSPLCAFHRERGGQRTAGCQAAARPAGPLTFLVADHVAISRHFDHKGGARGVRRETLARRWRDPVLRSPAPGPSASSRPCPGPPGAGPSGPSGARRPSLPRALAAGR